MPAADAPTPAGAERWQRDLPEGGRVHAFYFPPPAAPAPAVMVFHGNGELASDKAELAAFYRAHGFAVLVIEYRGYGGADGYPDFRPIMADALDFHDRLAARPETNAARIVAHGISLGGAFAAELTAHRPIAGLVLHSAFTSMSAMAWRRGWPGFLFGDDYRTLDRTRAYDGPVFVVHGAADGLIPVAHGRALASAGPQARFLALPDARHVIRIDDPRLAAALQDWLRAVVER